MKNNCPICGEGKTTQVTTVATIPYRGLSVNVNVVHLECDVCMSDFAGMEESLINRAAICAAKGSVDRHFLSNSFNRGAQSLDEATASARVMAESMANEGTLLTAPKFGTIDGLPENNLFEDCCGKNCKSCKTVI